MLLYECLLIVSNVVVQMVRTALLLKWLLLVVTSWYHAVEPRY